MSHDPLRDAWIVSGLPGAGKTTVGRLLAAKLSRAAHIEGDVLRRFIISQDLRSDGEQALLRGLNIRNQCLLARSFFDAGFVPVIDYFIEDRKLLEEYKRRLDGLGLHFVMLAPKRSVIEQRDRDRAGSHGHTHEEALRLIDTVTVEFEGAGLSLDSSAQTPEQSVNEILERKSEARL